MRPLLLQSTPAQFMWCHSHLSIVGDERALVEATKHNTLIAVSDGSYQAPYATAAVIIEDIYSKHRNLNKVIVPGGPLDLSAYRAETYRNPLHRLNYKPTLQGAPFGCDGLSALDVAFTSDHPFSVDDPNYDIIVAIHRMISQSPVSWSTKHVSGHQDDHKDFSSLDIW
jgi:hypothetical protein